MSSDVTIMPSGACGRRNQGRRSLVPLVAVLLSAAMLTTSRAAAQYSLFPDDDRPPQRQRSYGPVESRRAGLATEERAVVAAGGPWETIWEDDGDALPDGCGDEVCGPAPGRVCRPLCRPFRERLWVRGEYLLWWARGNDVPPLVTSSPLGTNPVLGQPGTLVLFGNSDLNTAARSGFKVTLGYWLWDCQFSGLEGSFLDLGRQTTRFALTSQEQPILARPFNNVQTGISVPDALLIGYPSFLSGSVNAQVATEFQAAEALWRENLWRDCDNRVDFLIGYRYARLSDTLSVNQTSQFLTVFPQGTTKTLFDQFDTSNEFHGGQLGLALQERCRLWTLELRLKVALGNTTALAVVDGATTTTVPGLAPVTLPGGVLAQPTNMGRYRQDHFAAVPELGLTLGYDLTCRLRATFGYNLIYWSHVARPGDQIDFGVNPTQFPPGPLVGPARPAFNFVTTDYWAQGMNFGLEYRF